MEEDRAALKTPHLKGLLVLAVGKHGGVDVEVEVGQLLSANVRDMEPLTFVADRSVVRVLRGNVPPSCPPWSSRAIEKHSMINTM